MSAAPQRPSEDELIARFFASWAGEGGLDLADDAALLRPASGQDLVLTVDAVVAGVHFFPDDPPPAVGHKALAVNMSDLAAKGAAPTGFVLSLALPGDWTEAWLAGFAQGLRQAAEAFGCPLVGGDTVRTPGPLAISITALGQVPHGEMVRRGAARPGDRLCVTGTIGDAALGLVLRRHPDLPWAARLSPAAREHLIDRYLRPRPRLQVAEALRRHATAAMDVSDGLAGDLGKMMRASGASADVDLAAIPLSQPARAALTADNKGTIDALVTGGDDYEVLCAVPDDRIASFIAAAASVGVPVTVIGTVVERCGLPVFRDGLVERRYELGSYHHF